MSRVNLYIEDTEIKLLVSSGSRVEKWASLVLEEGLVEQGLILNEDRVSESIKQLFKLQSIGQGNVTLGLSGLGSIFRVVSIPEVSRHLLPEAVGNEAARVMPVPLSQVYHSYQLLPSPKGEMRVFIAAYPRQATDTLISTVTKAGLKPDALDLAPLALARCVNQTRAIVVNSWLTFLDIVILADRIPQVIRSVSLPVESASLKDRLPAIIEEISRTITFYNSSNSGGTLDKTVPLVICGDIARQEQNWKPLEKLGFPVQVFKPPLEYKAAFDPSQYAVNCGLALKGQSLAGAASNSVIDFNILPQGYQAQPFSWARVLTPVGLVVALGALGWGYLFVNNMSTETRQLESRQVGLQAEIIQQRTKNNTLKSDIANELAAADVFPPQVTQINQQVAQLQAEEDFFNNLAVSYRAGLDDNNLDFKELINLVPNEMHVDTVELQRDGYHVNGLAAAETTVLDYARALKDGGRFTTVRITSMRVSDDPDRPGFDFELLVS